MWQRIGCARSYYYDELRKANGQESAFKWRIVYQAMIENLEQDVTLLKTTNNNFVPFKVYTK